MVTFTVKLLSFGSMPSLVSTTGAVEVHSLVDSTAVYFHTWFVRVGVSVRGRKQLLLFKQRMSELFFTLWRVLAMEIVLDHH